jgi:hypothetical protein
MSRILFILALLSGSFLAFSFIGDSQTKPTQQPQPRPQIDPAVIQYFAGKWGCSGEFSNGKKIEADLVFTPDLDNHWLQYRHTDRPPGAFKSLGMWGVDRITGKFISVMQDSSGSVRLFTSDGWVNNAIAFQSAQLLSPISRQERFTYTAQPAGKFKMTYEVSPDGNTWKLGDYIVCSKTP